MARANFNRAIEAWLAGHTKHGCAMAAGLSVGAFNHHLEVGNLTLPPRRWVSAADIGIDYLLAKNWSQKGFVERSPGGLYDRDQLLARHAFLLERPCARPGCQLMVDDLNPRLRFCPLHRSRREPGPEVLEYIKAHPGVRLYELKRHFGNANLKDYLVELEGQNLIRTELIKEGRWYSTYIWPIEQEKTG